MKPDDVLSSEPQFLSVKAQRQRHLLRPGQRALPAHPPWHRVRPAPRRPGNAGSPHSEFAAPDRGAAGPGILVTFFGTLAQTEDGLYIAQQKYFRSWASVWSPHDPGWKWIKIPPGGYQPARHAARAQPARRAYPLQTPWRKSGISLTHLGVMMLLLGQLATDLFSRESRMSFAEGEWRNYSEGISKPNWCFLGTARIPLWIS